MMTIPFLPLDQINAPYSHEIKQAWDRILQSGEYLLGHELEQLETELATVLGVSHVIGVGNGFGALAIALQTLGIGFGDEVLVPANTCIVTLMSVCAVGAVPVPIEAEPDTCNIDIDKIEQAISGRTKAVIPVHLYGRACNMERILEIAGRHQLHVIEDCAQAFGARNNNKSVGTFGTINAFSFYPGKNLGAFGDAGAIATDDPQLARKVKILRNCGMLERYRYPLCGVNSRMDEIQAAVLRVKLSDVPRIHQKRREHADAYLTGIIHPKITLPKRTEPLSHVWHQFVIRTEKRDQFQKYLETHGIETLIHYPVPPHKQAAFQHWNHLSFPVTEKIHREVLSLPVHQCLTQKEIQYIVEVCNGY